MVAWSDSAHRLLAVSLRDLPDELRPGHVHGVVNKSRFRARIVLGVVGNDHAGLQHTQKPGLS